MADFLLPKTGYLNFNSISYKNFIKDRLNANGVFTDQNFEGSNIAAINDILAYSFNILLYYLNRTSTESMFTESQIYENMNRIVKMLDYKPIGKQTSTLSFLASSTGLTTGLYTIPRYSYISLGNTKYSFNEDITFSVGVSTTYDLSNMYSQKLLYQGQYMEYPLYDAKGQDNEVIYVVPGTNVLIDHFNIDVYVKSIDSGTWSQWEKTPSLYLENALESKFELRLNENKNYEIKFGNNINGKSLKTGDKVAIYYLQSLGSDGEIGVNNLKGKKLTKYTSIQYDAIMNDVNIEDIQFMSLSQMGLLGFDNNSISTYYNSEETVESIRSNAPGIFRSQYRLVTEDDYLNYVKTNFANLVHDQQVANNWKYLSEQVKYYYDMGITNPNNVSNLLYNQLHFADSCNFNNIYITVVPKTISNAQSPTTYLSPSQKELILSSMKNVKTMTAEVILLDPVYIAVDICVPFTSLAATLDDVNNTILYVVKDPNSRRDVTSIQNDIYGLFTSYFDRKNILLGQILDINVLTTNILNVGGVSTFYTARKDDSSIKYTGLSMLTWNEIYPLDLLHVTKNTAYSYFKYLYLNDMSTFVNKIVVVAENATYENIEY